MLAGQWFLPCAGVACVADQSRHAPQADGLVPEAITCTTGRSSTLRSSSARLTYSTETARYVQHRNRSDYTRVEYRSGSVQRREAERGPDKSGSGWRTSMSITIEVNRERETVDVAPDTPLLLDLAGCDRPHGNQIRLRDRAMRSLRCVSTGSRCVPAAGGLDRRPQGNDHRGRRRDGGGTQIQKAWLGLEVVQCGYCSPGQIMSRRPRCWRKRPTRPTPTLTRRCPATSAGGTYVRIRAAISKPRIRREEIEPMTSISSVPKLTRRTMLKATAACGRRPDLSVSIPRLSAALRTPVSRRALSCPHRS